MNEIPRKDASGSGNPPQPGEKQKDDDAAMLNRLARKIDPPSREPDDKELTDPGRATPDAPPIDNRS